jgi:hypothetical protein
VKRRPEAVAWSRKVMTHSGSVKARIDATEKNAQTGGNYILYSLSLGGEELFLCWFPGFGHERNQ